MYSDITRSVEEVLKKQSNKKISEIDLQGLLGGGVMDNITDHEERIVKEMVIYYSSIFVLMGDGRNYVSPACPNNTESGWGALEWACRLALYRNITDYVWDKPQQKGIK